MRVVVGMLWLLALGGSPQAQGACPSQCSCSLHVLSDGSKARYGTRCAGWVAQPPRLSQLVWAGRGWMQGSRPQLGEPLHLPGHQDPRVLWAGLCLIFFQSAGCASKNVLLH